MTHVLLIVQVCDAEVERERHQGRAAGCSGGGREMPTEPTLCSVSLSVGQPLRCDIQHWGGVASYQTGSFPREGIPDISIDRGTEGTYEILHHRGKCVKQKEKNI